MLFQYFSMGVMDKWIDRWSEFESVRCETSGRIITKWVYGNLTANWADWLPLKTVLRGCLLRPCSILSKPNSFPNLNIIL